MNQIQSQQVPRFEDIPQNPILQMQTTAPLLTESSLNEHSRSGTDQENSPGPPPLKGMMAGAVSSTSIEVEVGSANPSPLGSKTLLSPTNPIIFPVNTMNAMNTMNVMNGQQRLGLPPPSESAYTDTSDYDADDHDSEDPEQVTIVVDSTNLSTNLSANQMESRVDTIRTNDSRFSPADNLEDIVDDSEVFIPPPPPGSRPVGSRSGSAPGSGRGSAPGSRSGTRPQTMSGTSRFSSNSVMPQNPPPIPSYHSASKVDELKRNRSMNSSMNSSQRMSSMSMREPFRAPNISNMKPPHNGNLNKNMNRGQHSNNHSNRPPYGPHQFGPNQLRPLGPNGPTQVNPQRRSMNSVGTLPSNIPSHQQPLPEPLQHQRALTTPASLGTELRDLDDDYKGYEAVAQPPTVPAITDLNGSPTQTEAQIRNVQREIEELNGLLQQKKDRLNVLEKVKLQHGVNNLRPVTLMRRIHSFCDVANNAELDMIAAILSTTLK